MIGECMTDTRVMEDDIKVAEDDIKVTEDDITKYSDERNGGWFATDRRAARFFGPRIGVTDYYVY